MVINELKMKVDIKTGHTKDTEWSDLCKVPDEVVIKTLRIELGQANSYIEELEAEINHLREGGIDETVRKLENDVSYLKGMLKASAETNLVAALRKKIEAQKKENVNLRQEISKQISENTKLKKELGIWRD